MQGLLTRREVAHDLRQPLATIRALAEAAETRPGLPAEARGDLEQIKEQVRDMTELCERLVKLPDGPRRVSVDEVARRITKGAEAAYRREIDLVAEPVTIEGDEVGIRRVLSNLVENACRAAGASEAVRVEVARAGDGVRIEVSDGGPGFGQAPPGSASMGLRTAESVVRAHGGRVEIASSRQLGGARVAVVLPSSPGAGVAHVDGTASVDGVKTR